MVSLKIEVKKKDVTWVVFLVAVLVISIAYAYGTSNPSVLGHSWGEIECNDCIGASDIAVNAVGNSEMIDNPSFSSITLGGVSKSSWPSGGSSSIDIYQCPKITYTTGCYGWQNGCEGQITTLGVCKYCSGGVWKSYSCTYLGKMILE